MSEISTRRDNSKRGWAAGLIGAVAVTALVVGVWAATSPSSGPEAGGGPATVPSPATPTPTESVGSGPASGVELFPPNDDVQVDTTRSAAVDPAGAWPMPTCAPAAADSDRVDFVSGTETGPEYSRDLAIAWYADDAAATAAYDGLVARIQACATSTGAVADTAPAAIGSVGVIATVIEPAVEGEAEVAIFAITRLGGVVALVVDHAGFYMAAVPAPEEATTTRDHAVRLIAEVCRSEPTRC